ncbi:MAG: transglutaminase family protein [Pirellulales bacterium]|nr:transglutaminase family protein [Pirellulales bacterium]
MADAPRFCRPAAYDAFVAQLSTLETTDSLVRAAVAVSMHELDGVLADGVERSLDELADNVRRKVNSVTPSALVARLHEVMFDERGFSGNTDDFYSPENSYLSRVLESRRGIPVTLSLIYKAVAQRLGLMARGINAPVHFLTAVESDSNWMIVDPFHGGRMLTKKEVFDQLDQHASAPVDRSEELLATATHGQWLGRIIRNLELVFARVNRENDRMAMRELQTLLAGMI